MQIFHRSTNTIAKVSIFGAVFFLAFFTWIFSTLLRSSYATGQRSRGSPACRRPRRA
jgi:hypothetical protein